jgi:hypothetical protein
MATRVVRTDDIDGTDATHQVSIVIDGQRCNLDLGDANFAAFEVDVKKYLDLAKAKQARQKTPAKKRSTNEPPGKIVVTMSDGTPVDKDAARIWGKENGWKVGMFVGPSLLEAYRDWVESGRPDPDDEGEEASDDQE